MRAALCAVTLTIVTLLPLAHAAEGTGESAASTTVAPTPGVDLRTIIASVSQRAHKKFIIDPRVMATVRLDGIDPRDVTYPMLLSILTVHAFSAYEEEGVVIIAPDANLRFFPSNLVKPDEIRVPDAEVVTTIVVLKSAKAPELTTILRPLVPPTGQINAFSDRNAVIITDRAANVRRIVAMLRELDKLPSFKPESVPQ